MALKSSKRERSSNDVQPKTQPSGENKTQESPTTTIVASSTDLSDHVDLQKIVSESQNTLNAQPQKRKRRTKAELAAANGGAVSSSPSSVNYAGLPAQDFTMATEPLLQALDMAAASYIGQSNGVKAKDLRASQDDLKKAAQSLNQPLTVISAHLGASADPVSAAYIAVGLTLGGLFLGKYFQAQELAEVKNEN